MAKGSGLGDLLFVRGYDLSGDAGSIERMAVIAPTLEVAGINRAGHERIYAHVDGELAFRAYFNDATDQEHLILRAKNSGSDTVMNWFHGSGIGNASFGLVAKQIDYAGMRDADGGIGFTIQSLGNLYGGEFTYELTAGKRTDTGATNGASLNNGAATAFGMSAYLHVFSFTGTSVTVAIQESSNDGAGDAFAAVSGMTFTAASAVTSQHLVTTTLTQAVEQYLRVSTTGTFNPSTFAVCATRYPQAL